MGDLICTLRRKTPQTEEVPKKENTLRIMSIENDKQCNVLEITKQDEQPNIMDSDSEDREARKKESNAYSTYMLQEKISSSSNTAASLSIMDTLGTMYTNDMTNRTITSVSSENDMFDSLVGSDISDDDSLSVTRRTLKSDEKEKETISCLLDKNKITSPNRIKKEITFNSQVEIKSVDVSAECEKDTNSIPRALVNNENAEEKVINSEVGYNLEEIKKLSEEYVDYKNSQPDKAKLINMDSNKSNETPNAYRNTHSDNIGHTTIEDSNKMKISLTYPLNNSDMSLIENKTKEPQIVHNLIEELIETRVRYADNASNDQIEQEGEEEKEKEASKINPNVSKSTISKEKCRESVATNKMSLVSTQSNKMSSNKSTLSDRSIKKEKKQKKSKTTDNDTVQKLQSSKNEYPFLATKVKTAPSRIGKQRRRGHSPSSGKIKVTKQKNLFEKKNSI